MKMIKTTRRQLTEREIYLVSFESLLNIVDAMTGGNIVKYMEIVRFEELDTYGVDTCATLYEIAKFLVKKIPNEDKVKLFGSGINLGSTDLMLNYIWMQEENTETAMGRTCINFLRARYGYIAGKLIGRADAPNEWINN